MRASTVAATAALAVIVASSGARAEPAGRRRPRPASPTSPEETVTAADRVLIVELVAGPPGGAAGAGEESLAGAAGRLTAALVTLSGEERTSRAPLDDVLALAGCGAAEGECLSQALEVLQVGQVVLGEIAAAGPGRLRVTLRILRPSQPSRERTLDLRGDDLAAIERRFRDEAGRFLRDPDAPPPRPPAPRRKVLPPPPPPAPEPGFSAGRVGAVTWAATGAGVGMAALGGVLLLVAADKQSDIDAAPTSTASDLEALADLEASGQSYARWGTGLLVVGAVAATAGAAFLYKQGNEAPPVTVAPTVGDGAVGAVVSISLGGP